MYCNSTTVSFEDFFVVPAFPSSSMFNLFSKDCFLFISFLFMKLLSAFLLCFKVQTLLSQERKEFSEAALASNVSHKMTRESYFSVLLFSFSHCLSLFVFAAQRRIQMDARAEFTTTEMGDQYLQTRLSVDLSQTPPYCLMFWPAL